MYMDADKLLDQWGQSINNADLSTITKLYAHDAILWGTFSKIVLDTPELIKEYFRELFLRKDLKLSFISCIKREFSDIYLCSGIYNFSYLDENELVKLVARYTFVIQKNYSENFQIIEHHSSLIPN